jgi:hypothetical protein
MGEVPVALDFFDESIISKRLLLLVAVFFYF